MFEALLDRYASAVHAKDVDAFVALYDEEVRVFDLWGRWSFAGAAEIRKSATDWFGSLGDERVEVEFSDVRTTTADDVAAVSAFVTFRGVSADGEALRAMVNRMTWVVVKKGDTWKVVHEHTSAPVDFETAKVILQR